MLERRENFPWIAGVVRPGESRSTRKPRILPSVQNKSGRASSPPKKTLETYMRILTMGRGLVKVRLTVVFGPDEQKVGNWRVGDPMLFAVEHVGPIAVFACLGLHTATPTHTQGAWRQQRKNDP